jgi:hypothetical protein
MIIGQALDRESKASNIGFGKYIRLEENEMGVSGLSTATMLEQVF